MAGIRNRLAHAWNAFTDDDDFRSHAPFDYGASYGVRPDRPRLRVTNERSIITSIYARISNDVASIPIKHVRLDDQGRYIEDMDSGLNNCLTVEANLDQGGRHLRLDAVLNLLDKGVIAIVPIDTSLNPKVTGAFDIQTMRVGEIVSWYPQHVRVRLYNERTGRQEEITVPKRTTAIVENPFYSVMNEPNSTLQRLIRKINLLDSSDELSSSGKLDMIIQLPYVIKSEARRQQAEQRRKDIEFQLKGSQYGIAYTDGTERITQLNRPAENNLLSQVQYLTDLLYGQLGLTKEIMDGTASEQVMLNYRERTIAPIVDAITEAMLRTFLTKTARTQKQTIRYFNDPFKLVPVANIAEIADKFTRNEILTANEVRAVVGLKPHNDPKAEKLQNSNVPAPSEPVTPPAATEEGDSQNGS